MPLLLILGVISTVFFLSMLRISKANGMKDFICAVCVWFVTLLMFISWFVGKNQTPDFQYVPAEVIAYNSTSTYFGTQNGDIFFIMTDRHLPDDTEYLLGMETNGTSDVKDDQIVTIWRVCD